jgi:hypothetical protein
MGLTDEAGLWIYTMVRHLVVLHDSTKAINGQGYF